MPSFIEIGPVGLEKKIFKFRKCVLLFPNKGRGLSFEKNLNPLYLKILCAKFG